MQVEACLDSRDLQISERLSLARHDVDLLAYSIQPIAFPVNTLNGIKQVLKVEESK